MFLLARVLLCPELFRLSCWDLLQGLQEQLVRDLLVSEEPFLPGVSFCPVHPLSRGQSANPDDGLSPPFQYQ